MRAEKSGHVDELLNDHQNGARQHFIARLLEREWFKTSVEVGGVLAVVVSIIYAQINQGASSRDMETALTEMGAMADAVKDQVHATRDLATRTGKIAAASDRTSVQAARQTAILQTSAATQDRVFSASFAPNIAVAITGVNGLEVTDKSMTLSVVANVQNGGNSPARVITSGIAVYAMETMTSIRALRAKAEKTCKTTGEEEIWQNDLSQSDGLKSADYQATLLKSDLKVPSIRGYNPSAVIGLYVVMCATFTSDALKGRRVATWSTYLLRERGVAFIQFAPRKIGGDVLWLEPMEMLQARNRQLDKLS